MNIHGRTNYGCGGTFMVWLPALPFMTGVTVSCTDNHNEHTRQDKLWMWWNIHGLASGTTFHDRCYSKLHGQSQ